MMNGNLIGNRFEIVETIGKGGMSIVYKAKCQMLNRYVALKVLRPEYREDKAFISRFKVEAQSAGSLSHPNIVSIHDVVHDDEQDYIVMEYVEGVTLKQYLEAKKVIPWREAVDYAAQICAGLDHAHKKGIIHKDIKPHNIMITREGTLKITDFGIAKVMSSSTITTGNTTMGSVHYFSPEQARGGYIDYRTDIYSLGVVLYEMVTGKLPFEGDTAIAVAMQHIEKEPVLPSVLNPEVPKSLENVIRRAMSKDQRIRYDSVNQMLVDLKKVYTGNQVTFNPEAIAIDPHYEEDSKDDEIQIISGEEDDIDQKRKKDKISVLAGIGAGLALVFILFFGGYHLVNNSGVEKIELPDFKNMTVEEAEALVVNTQLVIQVSKEQKSDSVEEGHIISQKPAAGKMVKENAKIKVVVSKGANGGLLPTQEPLPSEEPSDEFPMPDLVNLKKEEAEAALKEMNLIYSLVTEPSDTIPEGYVVRQIPTGETYIDKATTVTVYISAGKSEKTVDVPNMLGLSIDEAKSALLNAGLNWGQIVEVESTKAKGTILSQSIRAGIGVKEKTAIDLRISSGVKATATPKPVEATLKPTAESTAAPTAQPTEAPTAAPTEAPTEAPTSKPIVEVIPPAPTEAPASATGGDTSNPNIVIGPPNAMGIDER